VSPLKTILVGVAPPEAGILRNELSARAIAIEAELKTPAEAAGRFAGASESNWLFVIDARASTDGAPIRAVRSAFPTASVLALADAAGTAAAMLAINRAGADQVVSVPVNRQDLRDALDRLPVRSQSTGRAPILVVVSGTITGCGSSTVAASLADEIAHGFQVSTILVEARLQMGVHAMNLNVRPTITIADLVGGTDGPDADQVQKALIEVSPGLRLLAAPQDLVHAGPNAVKGLLKTLEHCKSLATVVVADAPCHYDDLHFETLWSADQVVLIANQSIPALRATRMMIDAVNRSTSVKELHVILNRYDPSIDAMSVKKISETLKFAGVRTIPNDYSNVMRAASEGVMLRSFAPDSPVVASIRALAAAVIGQSSAKTVKDSGLFSRLFGSKNRAGGS